MSTHNRHLDPNWQSSSHGRKFDDRDITIALAVSDEWETAGIIGARAGIDCRKNTQRTRIRKRLIEMADAKLIDWRGLDAHDPTRATFEFRRLPGEDDVAE